ncbi:XK-related protein 8-like [Clarias gariepinus]|uniref:XK-related protein 8-like n=1 Tax=Clarias gariepinus TaxID=13013 RepID=UPI00234DBEDF|nr:XK-related protein 8-like [Clarias gariepinus]
MKTDICSCTSALGIFASSLSLVLFFWNVAANLWAVVSFYQQEKYFSMVVFIFLVLSSSVLLNTFSWLFYSESPEDLDTDVDRFMKEHGLLALVHVMQLGVFLRRVGMLELSLRGTFDRKRTFQNRGTDILNFDLSALYLFKAFSESAPQLILMTTSIIQMEDFHLFTVIKIVGSLSSLSFTVVSYHRSMDVFVPEKLKMGWFSSIIYFLWNLFLIGPRVVCVSLFTSVLPYYIAAHFLSLWLMLVLWAWWQNTDFINSKAGDWLYRAIVGLIWYFSWFNVTTRNTKLIGIIYHVVMGADTMLLLGLWWWKRSVESARLSLFIINPYLVIGLLMVIYITGVLMKLVYYWKCHPNKTILEMNLKDEESEMKTECDAISYGGLEEDTTVTLESKFEPEGTVLADIHKRIRHMAVNFYS